MLMSFVISLIRFLFAISRKVNSNGISDAYKSEKSAEREGSGSGKELIDDDDEKY